MRAIALLSKKSIKKTIGKFITYKLNFSNDYVSNLVFFLLADEANELIDLTKEIIFK